METTFWYRLCCSMVTCMLLAGAAAAVGADTPAAAQTGKTVYIDPGATRAGDGSQAAPFRSWAQVTFAPGTAYLQRRGSVAHEEVVVTASGTMAAPIVIGAYGTGEPPVIDGSDVEHHWSPAGSGVGNGKVYRKQLSLEAGQGVGQVAEDGRTLRYLRWQGTAARTFAGASPGAFAYDRETGTVYLWCTGSDAPEAHEIRVSRRLFGIRGRDVEHVIVRGVHIRRVSFHGIHFENSSDIVIQDCAIDNVGGIDLGPPYHVQAGNGIEFANNVRNCLVDGCTIDNVFDSAVTVQTYKKGSTARDLVFSNLKISRAGLAGVEIAVLGVGGADHSQVEDVLVRRVTVAGAGRGWSGGGASRGLGVKINADRGRNNRLRGIRLQDVRIEDCTGQGMWLYGETGEVTVERALIRGNQLEGILLQDPAAETLGLRLRAAVIASNGKNGGKADKCGISINTPKGGGFDIANVTLYDNAFIGLAIWAHQGKARLVNSVFEAGSGKTHLFFAGKERDGIVDGNCFSLSGGPIVGYAGTAFASVADFRDKTGHGRHSFDGRHLLVDPEAGDFALDPGSPCRRGVVFGDAVLQDYLGRPLGLPPVMGAAAPPE